MAKITPILKAGDELLLPKTAFNQYTVQGTKVTATQVTCSRPADFDPKGEFVIANDGKALATVVGTAGVVDYLYGRGDVFAAQGNLDQPTAEVGDAKAAT